LEKWLFRVLLWCRTLDRSSPVGHKIVKGFSS
jgi:hypothetical protein